MDSNPTMDSMDQDTSNRRARHFGEPGVVASGGDRELGKGPECREALDRLYYFLDGELTEERRHQIQDHLDTCLPCLEAFDFEAEVKLLIARRCRDELPARLRVRVALALSEASGVPVAGSGTVLNGGVRRGTASGERVSREEVSKEQGVGDWRSSDQSPEEPTGGADRPNRS
jgi:mycothiol system anti-sigma-R factor